MLHNIRYLGGFLVFVVLVYSFVYGRPNEKKADAVTDENSDPVVAGIEDGPPARHLLNMRIAVKEHGTDKDHNPLHMEEDLSIDPDVVFHIYTRTTHEELNREQEALDRASAIADDLIVDEFVPVVEVNGLSLAEYRRETLNYDGVDGLAYFPALQRNSKSYEDADERISSGHGTRDSNFASDEN